MSALPVAPSADSGFFDFLKQRPRYQEGGVQRLNLRHRFLVQPFLQEIAGSRVLDLASHDGRWAYAYAAAGADSVMAYEARQSLVAQFHEFPDTEFKKRINLTAADLFDALASLTTEKQKFDVVTVLGVFYHVMDHYRLLRLVNRLSPRLIILDSEFVTRKSAVIILRREDPSKDLNTFVPEINNRAPVGIPSRRALEIMGQSLSLKVDWLDWEVLPQSERKPVPDYFRKGLQRRFTCTLRPKK